MPVMTKVREYASATLLGTFTMSAKIVTIPKTYLQPASGETKWDQQSYQITDFQAIIRPFSGFPDKHYHSVLREICYKRCPDSS